MEVVSELLKWITIILSVFTAPLFIWMLITAITGFFKARELQPIEKKQHKFAVLVCARNEESVIANLLLSLKQQDYPADHFKLIVIADNCTDTTAKVASQHGAIVYERFNEKERGKGYALHWGMHQLQQNHNGEFEAVCVFDADNLVAPDFLKEMNLALCSDAQIAIGYRDSKNIHDSWISEVYSLYWLMLQRFYHTPRHTLGLSSMVGGTGFAFKLSCLGEEGWHTKSITEDVEFSIQQICKGNKIVPARKAIFFDEQPSTFGVSAKQRFRWMVGGMQCIPLYMKQILQCVRKGDLKALDLAWYILFIPATALSLPLNLASAGLMLTTPAFQPYAIMAIGIFAALAWFFATFIAFMTLKLEHRKVRPMTRAILLYPIFMFTMMFIALWALVRPNTEWVPIAHTNQTTIEDLQKNSVQLDRNE